MIKLLSALTLLLAILFCAANSAHAATKTWVGNTAGANFSTAANWSASAFLSGDTMTFNAAGTAGTSLNCDFGAGTNVSTITFSATAPAYTINGNAITLTANIVASAAVNPQVINLPLTVAAARTITTSASASVALGGIIDSGAGTAGLVKAGAGTLTLSGANTYAGNTTLNVGGGTLTLSGNRTASATAIIQNGGILNIQNGNWSLTNNTSSQDTFTVGTGSDATVNHSAGTLSLTAGPLLLLGNVGNAGKTSTYNLSGGLLTIASVANAGVRLGVSPGTLGNNSTNVFNLSGTGVLNVNNLLTIGRVQTGVNAASYTDNQFNQTGGTATISTLTIGGATGGGSTNVNARLSLTAGTFTATNFTVLAAGDTNTAVITIGGTADVTLPAFPTVRGTASTATIAFDGGVLRPRAASATYLQGLDSATVTANGANFDVASGKDIIVAQALVNAPSATGKLTKAGVGVLVLSGVNTYTGTTTVSNGTLLVTGNSSAATGAVAVRSGATLGGSGIIGGAVTFDAGSKAVFTNGSTLTLSSSLTIAGSTDVHLSLANFVPNGNYTLATYSGGSGAFNSAPVIDSGSFLPGATATIVTSGGSVVLQVVGGSANLVWTGDGGANLWNINTAANWLNGVTPSVFNDSDLATFDDTGTNPVVDISATVSPGGVIVNSSSNYTFSGAGKISGTNALTKSGSGALTVSTANDYSGGTTISAGTVKLGANNVLGTGLVTLSGNGVILSSDSGTARLLTNNLTMATNVVLGDLANNGTLTLGGVVDLGGGAIRFITNHSRVVITGSLTNSVSTGFALRKYGAGDLVIAGDSSLVTPTTGSLEYVKEGSLVVDGASLTCVTGFFQLVGNAPNSVARLVVTNGGSMTATNNNSSNWRVGVNAQGGDLTATNIFEIAGTVKGVHNSYVANANQLFLGAGGTIALANLWPGGELTVRGVRPSDSTVAIKSEFNFRGGTLKAYAADTTFIAGLTNCFVGSGGGTIDSAGFDITIPQPLVDGAAAGYGSGGLTKSGTGTLTLSGANTYTGGTTVSNGTLLVTGNSSAATGAVAVKSGATLGGSGIIGGAVTFDAGSKAVFTNGSTLTLSSSLTIAGSTDVHLTLSNNVPAGNYTLATYSGGSGSFNSTPVIDSGSLATNTTVSILTSGGSVVLQVRGPANLVWTGDGGANLWNINTAANWLDGASPSVFYNNDTVLFNNTGSGNPVVNLATTVTPAYVVVDSTSAYTLTGAGGINGTNAVTNSLSKLGSGLLTIACSNSYTADTLIGQGVLVADNLSALGSSRVQFNPGISATLRLASSLTLSNNLTMTTKNGANVDLGSGGTTLTINHSGNFTCGVVFTNAGKIVKSGPGRMTLTGNSTHTGGITVNAGTLRIGNGTDVGTLTSDITLQSGTVLDVLLAPGFALVSGQTLAGSGVVTGAVTVASGSLLRPGLGGTDTTPLTFKHALTLNAGSTNLIAINRTNTPNNAAGLVVGATLTLGGDLTVTNVGPAPLVGDTFTLFSAVGITSDFTTTNLPSLNAGLKWNWNPTNGTLSVVASIASTPTNITYSVSGNTLTLTWPESHLGWVAQSNSVNLADTNYWFIIPDSELATNLVITLDPALTNVFYRLQMP